MTGERSRTEGITTMSSYDTAVALWQNRQIQNDAELAEALSAYSVNFAYHSGKIENPKITYNDTREIFEHDGVSAYTGDLRTLFEIRNERDAGEFLLAAFHDKKAINEKLIKTFHLRLTQNTDDSRRWRLGERPGEYKKHDFVTGRGEIGASAEDVSEEMAELLEEMRDFPSDQVLIAAAYFHAKFENIHPFADGNGRTGRVIMNYLLLLYNHPPIIIHQEDRKDYYHALECWDERQELAPLIDFLKHQTVKTWEKQIKRVSERQNPD